MSISEKESLYKENESQDAWRPIEFSIDKIIYSFVKGKTYEPFTTFCRSALKYVHKKFQGSEKNILLHVDNNQDALKEIKFNIKRYSFRKIKITIRFNELLINRMDHIKKIFHITDNDIMLYMILNIYCDELWGIPVLDYIKRKPPHDYYKKDDFNDY